MNNNKNSRIEFRIDANIKIELNDLAVNSGLKLSEYLRNSVSSLVNRKDEIESLISDYEGLESKVNLFLDYEDIEVITTKNKDEIIYHCKTCMNNANIVKFTRKSDKFQSNFDVKKFGKQMLKCGELLYLAVGSSSFYDTAFLRCIEYANTIETRIIEVLALTRSEYETITRSVLIADKVISKIADYHISLKGIDIMMLRIACVLYQNNQIRRMNTQYSYKTSLFWVYLNFNEEKARKYYEMRKTVTKYKNFKNRSFETYQREYKAMYELNNLDKDKFRFHLAYLIASK